MLIPTRRTALRAGFAAAALAAAPRPPLASDALAGARQSLRVIEDRLGGRLGVAVRDTSSGRALLHRADARFPMCSTFKVLAAAAILARVDAGRERLERTMPFTAADLDSHAPVTGGALKEAGGEAGTMSLADLCAAAVVWSDNTAANLMLQALGGPPALTAWLRGIGDQTSRLDRTEPTLNTAIPGDPRDTTSPAAIAEDLERLLIGDVLSPASRGRLEGWMVAARTGLKRLRAGLPQDWAVGDKTGSGDNATANVVAILRPPGRAPLVAAIYLTGSISTAEERDAAHAEIGRLVAVTF
ncbi:class A beta-lactamase [Methylobacterium durans]|uniref:class A beta-lactamase n=1 Tax=Methylobacterium durans TaxID=2202825 RepID=UPI002698B15C